MTIASASVSYLTLVMEGHREDIVVPSGVTLARVLRNRRVPEDLVPCTPGGEKLPGAMMIGREIRNGALVLLQPAEVSTQAAADGAATLQDVAEAERSPIVYWAAVTIALLLSASAVLGVTSRSRTHTLIAAGLMLLLGLLYALRPCQGHPVSETLATVAFGACAGILVAASNFDDARYQTLICGFAAAGALATVRWAWRGPKDPPTERVSGDCAAVGLLGASAILLCMLTKLDVVFVYAALFGVAAPLMQALPGFSVNLPQSRLIDEATIVREASSVRGAKPSHLDPVTGEEAATIVKVGDARYRLWTLLLCADVVATLPAMLRAAGHGGVQGALAGVSVGCAGLAFLLVPRTAAAAYVRILPRATVGLLLIASTFVMARNDAINRHIHPYMAFGTMTVLALVVLVASIPINRGRKSLAFTRMGDILQSFCCTWSLPFALCGMGVVTLVRTGGIP